MELKTVTPFGKSKNEFLLFLNFGYPMRDRKDVEQLFSSTSSGGLVIPTDSGMIEN